MALPTGGAYRVPSQIAGRRSAFRWEDGEIIRFSTARSLASRGHIGYVLERPHEKHKRFGRKTIFLSRHARAGDHPRLSLLSRPAALPRPFELGRCLLHSLLPVLSGDTQVCPVAVVGRCGDRGPRLRSDPRAVLLLYVSSDGRVVESDDGSPRRQDRNGPFQPPSRQAIDGRAAVVFQYKPGGAAGVGALRLCVSREAHC